jgi:hypothetical protein
MLALLRCLHSWGWGRHTKYLNPWCALLEHWPIFWFLIELLKNSTTHAGHTHEKRKLKPFSFKSKQPSFQTNSFFTVEWKHKHSGMNISLKCLRKQCVLLETFRSCTFTVQSAMKVSWKKELQCAAEINCLLNQITDFLLRKAHQQLIYSRMDAKRRHPSQRGRKVHLRKQNDNLWDESCIRTSCSK